MTAMPLVSVVIPAYNAESHIAEALESLRAQTCRQMEIIVVDDGSSDRTAEIVTSRFPEVRCVRQPNGGASSARNRGVQEARGEWVAFLDADDAWHPDKLRAQLDLMRRHPEVRLCRTLGSEIPLTDVGPVPSGPDGLPVHELFTSLAPTLMNPYFTTSTVVVRRDSFLAVGGFDTSLKIAEDIDLYLRILLEAPTVLLLKAVAVYKRPVPGSLGDDDEAGYVQLLSVYERFFQRNPQLWQSVGAPLIKRSMAELWARYAGSLRRNGKRGLALRAAAKSLLMRPSALAAKVLLRSCLP
jgi:glycosyltransferase involved in cell wall biosynthesis